MNNTAKLLNLHRHNFGQFVEFLFEAFGFPENFV